jgi:hypothetical protein
VIDQTIVNWLLAGLGGLIGFLLQVVWQAVKDLQRADKDLAERVGEMEVLMAGSYITKIDFVKTTDAIFRKLDRIEDKLDGKADK